MSDNDMHGLASGIVRIHLVISRAVATARQQARAHATGTEAARVSPGFADYLQALVSVLHAHHLGEEEIAFPALRAYFSDAPWDVLIEEHQAVVSILTDLERYLAKVRQHPSANAWMSVADALDRLDDVWGPHYQREEANFTPAKLAAMVADDEQAMLVAKMAAHGQQHATPDYLVVPFLLYNLDGDERRAMSAQFPPVVTEQLVPIVWQDKWSAMKPFLLA